MRDRLRTYEAVAKDLARRLRGEAATPNASSQVPADLDVALRVTVGKAVPCPTTSMLAALTSRLATAPGSSRTIRSAAAFEHTCGWFPLTESRSVAFSDH